MLAKIIGLLSAALIILGACTTPPDGTPVTTPPINADCGSTTVSLKKYLMDAGYSEDAASGILGNLLQESGVSIYSIEDNSVRPIDTSFIAYDLERDQKTFSGGFGIAQWDYKTRVKNLQIYANNHANGVVVSEKAQFGYLVQELSNSLSPSVLNGRSLEEVTWVIHRSYENPFSVRCTESNPCTSYSFTCESGYPCRYTGRVNSSGKRQIAYWNSVNTHDARTSYSEIINNKTRYWAAWLSLDRRTSYAVQAKNLSTASCDTDPTGDTDPHIPTPDHDPEIPVTTITGAIGATSSNGFYRQDSYSSTVWRGDGSTIRDSGCSLIAAANSMKVLNVSGSDPTSIASYTRGVISGPNQTGWGSSSMSINKILNHYNLSYSTLWSSYNTSTSAKIQAIRGALASGKAIIAGGDRKHVSPELQSCPNTSSGVCAFSYNGHFVAIVGITADDKLVIANPARGNGSGNVFNAENVLKYSNKAIAVSR